VSTYKYWPHSAEEIDFPLPPLETVSRPLSTKNKVLQSYHIHQTHINYRRAAKHIPPRPQPSHKPSRTIANMCRQYVLRIRCESCLRWYKRKWCEPEDCPEFAARRPCLVDPSPTIVKRNQSRPEGLCDDCIQTVSTKNYQLVSGSGRIIG
jgi:hypothetical protein